MGLKLFPTIPPFQNSCPLTTFDDSALRDSYDPWISFDLFGRAGLLAKLDPDAVIPQEQAKATEPEVSQTRSPQKNLAVPRGKKRSSKLLTKTELTRSAEKLRAGPSHKL